MSGRRLVPVALACCAMLVAAGCGANVTGHTSRQDARGANAEAGGALITALGCGGCHEIAGIRDARGRVGPSLRDLADRRTIAGALPNTPDNVARWVHDPPAIDPGTLMPDLGVSRSQSRDIAAYLDSH